MTQSPPQPPYSQYPQQPLPHGYPPPNPRPTSVTVLAIIGIIFAALRIVCVPMGLIPFFVSMAANPVIDAYRNDSTLMAFLVTSGILTFILAVVLLLGCIGALGLKPWARRLLVRFSIVQIAFELIVAVFQIALVIPRITADLGPGPTASQATAGTIGGILGAMFGLIVPVLLLVFMTRPHVVAAFEHAPTQ
ncbi:MAG: hypothetical protein QOF78_1221 [Phycisphaerales bacterium]|jgi:hypothetical protein|nr:hypothetical protein [Phycisphaerales bacterium]